MPRLFPLLAAFVALAVTAPAAAAITGVCPDGSIFIVQSADAIPCRDARRVDPNDMPPIQPDMLPRPYGWERFNQRADPNNPYNLVGRTRRGAAPPPQAAAPPPALPPQATPPESPTPPRVAWAAPPVPEPARAPGLGLTQREIAELDEIVQLLQSMAPATVARLADDGSPRLSLQLARSAAFEQRLHAHLARDGGGVRGPVVLFRAAAEADEAFHANLTFVQGHVAFHPDPANPDQLGLIAGGFGPLGAGERVLGYAVLPEHLDPAQPLDIYWNDRRISATLHP